ncbi:MAG: hypothetical protein ACRC6U_11445 [Fusobacteriaceae bacterium]
MYVWGKYELEYEMSLYFKVDQVIFKKLSVREFENLLTLNYSECKKILDTLQGIREQLKHEKVGINYSNIRYNRKQREKTALRRKEVEREKV